MSRLAGRGAAYRLDLVAGLTDGILTALTLGAGHMLAAAAPATPGLAFRVAGAAAVSGAFVFLVAHYADLRGELVEAERQLNLVAHGRFATSRLGRAVFREAVSKAAMASLCTFAGALLPMLVGALAWLPRWTPIAVSIVALCLLGWLLARTVFGRPLYWVLALGAAGGLLAWLGAALKIA
ncbi:hypothetical protein [Fulvimonas soli]|uniref:VIT1/CCC1 family predicted Fe2+/Mn2+ transporter n=1 Tax=Fulvimonas soli TaxID=155197 RepID=A0A316IBJ1_9GAMM|nr:hypothetical protein [Fulvimonas soli]PWK89740.1 VIT1/CCC1 family predicted Fe2+/Mn2+ transporter [Fulvimonas soli]